LELQYGAAVIAMESGELLDRRFAISAFHRSGGMGAVYRAVDRETGKRVAIKVVHPDASDQRRLEREARVLESLSAPGIVRYVARGSLPDGRLYLAMEWLQ